jgi:glutamine synthetase
LVRSQSAIDNQGKRLLKNLGFDEPKVVANVGWEQEFFMIDREHYIRRPDLMASKRTVLGASPPLGQVSSTLFSFFYSLTFGLLAF